MIILQRKQQLTSRQLSKSSRRKFKMRTDRRRLSPFQKARPWKKKFSKWNALVMIICTASFRRPGRVLKNAMRHSTSYCILRSWPIATCQSKNLKAKNSNAVFKKQRESTHSPWAHVLVLTKSKTQSSVLRIIFGAAVASQKSNLSAIHPMQAQVSSQSSLVLTRKLIRCISAAANWQKTPPSAMARLANAWYLAILKNYSILRNPNKKSDI